jgi:hypothetical protein
VEKPVVGRLNLMKIYNASTFAKEKHLQDKKYWTDELYSIPDAPKMEFLTSPYDIIKPVFERVSRTITDD